MKFCVQIMKMSSLYLTYRIILVLKYMELFRELMKIPSCYKYIFMSTAVVLCLEKILLADDTFVS